MEGRGGRGGNGAVVLLSKEGRGMSTRPHSAVLVYCMLVNASMPDRTLQEVADLTRVATLQLDELEARVKEYFFAHHERLSALGRTPRYFPHRSLCHASNADTTTINQTRDEAGLCSSEFGTCLRAAVRACVRGACAAGRVCGGRPPPPLEPVGDPPCCVQHCGLGAGRRLHLQLRVRRQRKGAQPPACETRRRCPQRERHVGGGAHQRCVHAAHSASRPGGVVASRRLRETTRSAQHGNKDETVHDLCGVLVFQVSLETRLFVAAGGDCRRRRLRLLRLVLRLLRCHRHRPQRRHPQHHHSSETIAVASAQVCACGILNNYLSISGGTPGCSSWKNLQPGGAREVVGHRDNVSG